MDLSESPGPNESRPPPRPPARPCPRPRRPRDLALLAAVLGALLAAVLGALLALAARGYVGSRESQAGGPRESATTRRKTMFFFSALDVNRDMYISAEEFKPIAEMLRVITPLTDSENAQEAVKEEKFSLKEKLTVVARFQPLLLDTMSNSKSGFKEISDIILSGIKNWTNPALSSSVFSASQFKAFLPPRNDMELGEIWWIIPDTVLTTGVYLSDNRFYPPPPKGKEVIIHKLLSMFHPRPFVKTRFGPQGTVACLTAISNSYYTIAFRIHAEFQLNQPLHYPFWFCPSQFTGHIILSKDSSHVQDFKLFVPNERSLNVGLQWLHGPLLNPHVDLGYLPQMELEASGPSMPSIIQDEKSNETDSCLPSEAASQLKMEDILWQQELSREEAAQQLERAMYDFKKNEENKFYKKLAQLQLEKYKFPVESLVCLPNGTVVNNIHANDFLFKTPPGHQENEKILASYSPMSLKSPEIYEEFLREGLRRAQVFFQP